MRITRLYTESQDRPLGICQGRPAFSWNIETSEKGWKQKVYRVAVAETEENLEKGSFVWDSQEVFGDKMTGVMYKGEPLKSDTRYFWRVWTEGDNGTKAEGTSWFHTGLFSRDDWHGKWIGEQEDHVYHIFRKSFLTEKKIVSAMLYVCGLGHYEAYLNGQRVGEAVLEPGWTNYDKSCLYSCYDVTANMQEGMNGIGLILGDGMYNVPGGRYVYFPRSYGKCKFLLQLNLVYEDGEKQEIVSDTSWKMAPSALEFSCIYGGEDFDARKKKKGFSEGNYKTDKQWEQVIEVEPAKGILTAQNIEPLKVMERYELSGDAAVTKLGKGIYLCDFGRNFSGWIRAKIRSFGNMSGHEITFTPGEILSTDGKPDQKVTGKGYQWKYVMDETLEQAYHPRFTYTGFRYVLVEGAEICCGQSSDGEFPVVEALTGEFIYPDNMEYGGFSCSNDLYNRIHNIICQAIRSNTKSIFTDCPHREKLGWLEQTHLIGPSIMYNYNVHNLYEKIERDMQESQGNDGLVPDICPQYIKFGYHEGFNDSPEWGSAVIINPWYLYKRFGDFEIFSRFYETMKQYMDYLTRKTHHHILHHGLGDWLDIGPMTPYSQNTPVPVVATNIYYYDLTIMKKVASLLGKDEDASRYEELLGKVYEEYNLQFFDDQTNRYANGSQAAQAMSLVTGLVQKGREEKVLAMLVKDIESRNYQITAGDVGHPFVIAALMQYGRNDVIDRMMQITEHPGYGYQVVCGATTLTEEWDGPDPKHPHGSQNHLMLGSAEEWFYGGLAGIRCIRAESSFEEILIHPYFSPCCDYAEAWTTHPYGKVKVRWDRVGNEIKVKITLPPNARGVFVNDFDGSKKELVSGTWEFMVRNLCI